MREDRDVVDDAADQAVFSDDTEIVDVDDGDTEVDYADALRAYFGQVLPDELEPLPPRLLESLTTYLRALTEEVVPPPPDLQDDVFAYLESQVQHVEGLETFAQVRDRLVLELFPRLTPVDFTPLDPDGVEGAIQKLTAGRDIKGPLDGILLLLKGYKKLRELQRPSNVKYVWTMRGPFELKGIDDAQVSASFKVGDLVKPNPQNSKLPFQLVQTLRRFLQPPKDTDVVTADLSAVNFVLSESPIRVTLSSGSLGRAVLVSPTQDKARFGPIMCNLVPHYNPLKSRKSAWVDVTVQSPFQGDHIKDDYVNVIVRMNVRYYSAIIT